MQGGPAQSHTIGVLHPCTSVCDGLALEIDQPHTGWLDSCCTEGYLLPIAKTGAVELNPGYRIPPPHLVETATVVLNQGYHTGVGAVFGF